MLSCHVAVAQSLIFGDLKPSNLLLNFCMSCS